jgi:hypothetical protein
LLMSIFILHWIWIKNQRSKLSNDIFFIYYH